MVARFSRLDRPSIRQLKPGQKITERGITVEALDDGDRRYSVNIMVDARRVHRVIGKESDGVTRHQAEQFIEQARSEARAGRLSLPKGRKTPLAFEAVADSYLDRQAEAGGKSLAIKRRHLKGNLGAFFGAARLDAINPFMVERYKRERQAAGASPATINREISTLGHLLNRAVEWGWLDRPIRLRRLPEPPGRITALTDAEIDRLMQAAIAGADMDLWLFIEIAVNTSMRHGEILRARWEHLDPENRRLFIPRAKAGTREQPITASLADTLAHERAMRADQTGWVFPTRYSNSKIGYRHDMTRPFRDAVRRAGLDPKLVTPHTLRHSVITKLVQAGTDLPTVQRISGHKTLAMVLRYSHVHAPHIDAAMTALDRRTITPELHRDAPETVSNSSKSPSK